MNADEMSGRRMMMSRSPKRWGVARHPVAAMTAVALFVALLAAPIASPQASAQSAGLETLGELPTPPCEDPDDNSLSGTMNINIIDVDTDARRLYTRFRCNGVDQFAVYDISTEIPTIVQVGPPIQTDIRTWTSYTVRVAPDLGRIFVLGLGGAGDVIVIEVLDLQTLEVVDTWRMTEEKTRGFLPLGLDYDQDRDRIYLVGTFEASLVAHSILKEFGNGGAVPNAAIAAVDAGSGDLIWINPLQGCDAPLRSNSHGSLVALSEARPMLYAFCAAGATGFQPAGQGGIVRLDVSEQDDATGVVDFPSDFFPVSGDYTSGAGVAALDRKGERFVAHSLADRTHGAWVFDGRRSSWIGFVAAPDNTNAYYGLDPSSGKHYMGGGDTGGGTGYINITDARATPVPQGRLFSHIHSSSPWAQEVEGSLAIVGNMVVDPSTGRLFVAYQQGPARGVLVLHDSTPPITPRTPLDLDELTHDLPDDDKARLEFSANTSGFGAQYVQVGGWENVYTRPTLPFLGPIASTEDNPANIRYGNRGATMSLVEETGIASSGSSATAIATQPDDNTPADAETKQNEATDPVGGLPSSGDEEEGEDVEETDYATCLDGVGEAVTNEQGSQEQPAHAVVVCDLAHLETTAHARFSGGSGGGGLIVSDSSFDGRTYREPDRGAVTETEAIAEGIFFGEADVGGFGIDRVTSTATTYANGLDGTSHVKWVRTVEGMRTFAADGTSSEPESCTTIVESGKDVVEEGECESLQEDLNGLIPSRFEVRFPLPEVVATPGGAFASVQETETDFLGGQATYNDERRVVPGMEMTVFADGSQRGRLWVQLAAVKGDATFIRSPLSQFQPFSAAGPAGDAGPSPTDGQPADESTGSDQSTSEESTDVALPAAPPPPSDDGGEDLAGPNVFEPISHQERLVGAFGWVPALRSLGDAALTGALYLVFLLPVAEIVRRRRLLDVLTDGGPADQSSLSAPRVPARVSGSPVGVSGAAVRSPS